MTADTPDWLQLLRAARDDLGGVSNREIARAAKLSPSTVGCTLNGEMVPKRETLGMLVAALLPLDSDAARDIIDRYEARR